MWSLAGPELFLRLSSQHSRSSSCGSSLVMAFDFSALSCSFFLFLRLFSRWALALFIFLYLSRFLHFWWLPLSSGIDCLGEEDELAPGTGSAARVVRRPLHAAAGRLGAAAAGSSTRLCLNSAFYIRNQNWHRDFRSRVWRGLSLAVALRVRHGKYSIFWFNVSCENCGLDSRCVWAEWSSGDGK